MSTHALASSSLTADRPINPSSSMRNISRVRSRAGTFTCLHCGVHVDCGDYNPTLPIPKIMEAKRLCFTCALWLDRIDNPSPHQQVINGAYYIFRPWDHDSTRKARCIQLNNGLVARSNDIMLYGQIPELFVSTFPDTARFITPKAYQKIVQHPFFKCKAKGCWDRYHCFWYDMTLEVDGPWNKIPSSHKIGDEYCQSFLNVNEVYE